ncbi:MAG TPA: hypothetical protein VIU61_24875 [Kofleriaceae bacterium]
MTSRILAVVLLVACSKGSSQPTVAGAPVIGWRAGASHGKGTVTSVGEATVTKRTVTVLTRGNKSARITISITHGPSEVKYPDGSTSSLAVPRGIDAAVLADVAAKVEGSCDSSFNGPYETPAGMLNVGCRIVVDAESVAFHVWGDGQIAESRPLVSGETMTGGRLLPDLVLR